MPGTTQLLDVIEIDLGPPDNLLTVYMNIWSSSLSQKWLVALNDLLKQDLHLEKNYCFFGFPDSQRNGEYILSQVNASIAAINKAELGYQIDDYFTLDSVVYPGPVTTEENLAGELKHDKLNQLHRYFEDLQGVSGAMSPYYQVADAITRWHIRQLNLLCHEFESWALSAKKKYSAPEWQRPSQIMCWLNAPRFKLEPEDYELFGIETMNRPLGGVYVGVNKAIGKHHWEVFIDEAEGDPEHRIDTTELTTTSMRSQLEAAGDFDIEWANNPGDYHWQKTRLRQFRQWLINNGFDPDDKSLTLGHPQIGQVDLIRSFGTQNYQEIWSHLQTRLNVHEIRTSTASAVYEYNWSDPDYAEQQIRNLQ